MPDNGKRYELCHGELIEVPSPKWKHYDLQIRLSRFLQKLAGESVVAGIELGFKMREEFRIADIGLVSKERWDRTLPNGYFESAPDLVVEIPSPSNTIGEMLDKERLCLENGAREFWVVDLDRQHVKISTPDGHTVTYKLGQSLPLFFAPGVTISVAQIFA